MISIISVFIIDGLLVVQSDGPIQTKEIDDFVQGFLVRD